MPDIQVWDGLGGLKYYESKLVLAEIALALARNRQASGPLETLKLSSSNPLLAGPGSIPLVSCRYTV